MTNAVKESIKEVNPYTYLGLSLNSGPGGCNFSSVSCDMQHKELNQMLSSFEATPSESKYNPSNAPLNNPAPAPSSQLPAPLKPKAALCGLN